MLVIVSGLSIQDPRERPAEHREKADALHRRFWAPAAADSGSRAALRQAQGTAQAQGAGSGDADGSDFLALAAAVGLPPGVPARAVRQRVPPDVPRRVPALPAHPGVAGPAHPAQADLPRARPAPQRAARARRTSTSRPWPVCCPTSAWPTCGRSRTGRPPPRGRRPTAGVPRRPRHPVRHQPRLERGQDRPAPGDGRRDRRDHPALGPDGRPDHRRAGRGGRRAPAQADLLRAALVGPRRAR